MDEEESTRDVISSLSGRQERHQSNREYNKTLSSQYNEVRW